MSRLLLVIGLLATAGCPKPDPAGGLTTTNPPNKLLDYNEFVCSAQPVLVKRCSYLGCHGQPDHALRIYSPGKLRAGEAVTRAERDAQLTAAEVDLNFQSAVGTVYNTSPVDRNVPSLRVLLLEKPVKAIFGGAEHHGVGVFPSDPNAQSLQDDKEWSALAAWVGGKTQPKPVTADCQMTFDNLGLMPR